MLLLQNLEGDCYNPFIDNYLVLQINNYIDTQLEAIEGLVKAIEASHDELIVVETGADGFDLIGFLEDIGKILIYKTASAAGCYYLTIQKNLLD